jgi:hypothetical protein
MTNFHASTVRREHSRERGSTQVEHVLALCVAVLFLPSAGLLGGAFRSAIAGESTEVAAGAPVERGPTAAGSAAPLSAQAGAVSELAHLAERAKRLSHPFDDAQTLVHEASRQRLDRLLNDGTMSDLVVVPSLTLDAAELASIKGVTSYEERVLWSLRNLERPGTRVTFVTSTPIDRDFSDYFLSLIPNLSLDEARSRVRFLSPNDAGTEPLARKVLLRPALLDEIRDGIQLDRSVMLSWTSSPYDAGVASALGIPHYAPHPLLNYFGTKSGGRELFREAGVPIPFGFEHVRSVDEIVSAVNEVWKENPDLSRVVVKHNEGTSGQGNAILDLRKLRSIAPDTGASDAVRKSAIERALPKMKFAADEITAPEFFEIMERQGGVVEAFFDGAESSPSSQIDVYVDGRVVPAATHDQLLEGPGNQVYAGASFPARREYRIAMQDDMIRVGELLKQRGVVGRFAGDFMVRTSAVTGELERIAIELNLRQGGTTHPGRLLEMLAGGGYDAKRGVYAAADGTPRTYFATDSFTNEALRGTSPGQAIAKARNKGLLYDDARGSGVVFHMLGALEEHGKMGFTAIAHTRAEASALFQRIRRTFGEE